MTDVTHILSAIQQGDPHAAEQLLPLVYDELRKLAGQKLSHEKPGQTLDATSLVHEAYLRLGRRSHRPGVGEAAPRRSLEEGPDLGQGAPDAAEHVSPGRLRQRVLAKCMGAWSNLAWVSVSGGRSRHEGCAGDAFLPDEVFELGAESVLPTAPFGRHRPESISLGKLRVDEAGESPCVFRAAELAAGMAHVAWPPAAGAQILVGRPCSPLPGGRWPGRRAGWR
jgi:hypothetical protein